MVVIQVGSPQEGMWTAAMAWAVHAAPLTSSSGQHIRNWAERLRFLLITSMSST